MTIKPSDIPSQVTLPAGITPLNDNATFPTHYSTFGFGGMRTAANITERNAIPAERRVEGMLVFAVAEDRFFTLRGGILNANWVEFASGGSTTAGLTQVAFISTQWAAPTPDDGTLRLNLLHNLNTNDINVTFYETGQDGSVEVQWESVDADNVMACIPNGFAFTGIARFIAGQDTRGVVTSFEETFDTSKFVETSSGSGIFEATFNHGLASTDLEFHFYLDNNCPLLICANTITTATLTIQVPAGEQFGGRVFITKVG